MRSVCNYATRGGIHHLTIRDAFIFFLNLYTADITGVSKNKPMEVKINLSITYVYSTYSK